MESANGPAMPTIGSAVAVPLWALLRDLVEARAVFARERCQGRRTGMTDAARAHVLFALKAYTAALEERRLPVPYALRDELRIQQRVCR